MIIVRTLAKSLRKYKKETIITPIFISVEVLMECTIPLLISRIINTLEKSKNLETGSGGLLQSIIIYGLILVAMAGISLLSGIMAAKFGSRASAGFATNLRKDMFYNIQNFSFANIDKFSTPSLVTRLTTDVTNVQQAFMMIIRIGVRAPLMMAFAMVISFTFHATLPLVFLIVVPILGSGMYLIITKAHPLFKKVFQKYDNLNNSVQENIRGMRVVKSYVREDYEINKFKKTASDVRKDFIKAERIIAFTGPLMTFCMYICMLAISYFGAKIIISSNASALEVGELSSLITYSMQILSSLMMFSFVFLMCTISAESADRIAEVIREKSTITNPENPVYELQDGSVSFKNVSFKYSERAKRYALSNINLDIKTGETIGILGGTGSSKTSLIQLIPRLYDATEGEVYVGSRNVKEYDLDTLRNGVAVVLQKNTLFSGTIEENLRWGNKDATMEEIKEACQLAQAEEFIERFPEKYNTYIEQGGTNVSGGQKQRLCIARALLKKPKILILDDSTSAVDTKTDALIRNGLKNYLPDTTKIIIAQRVASVENADKIVIMDNGTINQIGTHEELLKTNKIYQGKIKWVIQMNKKPNNHPKLEKSSLFRLIKDLWSFNKGKWILVFIAMAFMVVGNSAASIFIKNITAIIVSGTSLGFDAIKSDLLQVILTMAVIYVLSISSSILMNQLMAYVTQDSLYRIREKMFVNMEQLPIKYFDQNNIGDVMSYYTNDTDTLRQLISQGLTQIVQSFIMVVVLVCIMLTYSIWLALIIFTGIFAMIKVTKKVGGNARSGFIAQQKAIAKVEGFVEEMMHGQKVIKVFCHEEEAKKDFDKLNEALNDAMYFANTNASRMGPIMGNIGNIMYVFLAFIGALLITLSLNGHNIYNLSITGLKVVSVDYFLPIVISFLTLARQFSINVNQGFQQFNQIVMASAAATRIYKLIDEPKEVDNGYVTLVNVKENENHELVETTERTGIWAWKHPHTETGEVTYKRLEGDIRMIDVDFGYSEDKIVLHNINLYALPGQKVAFVGSTGAGKTTITNLLNRFYDIADGKIRYDGININKIKKADLRRSLGIVLQDTNLFTGTVMENIRYGRLDATDEECIEAAKLANAHDFITRLPDGYNTMLLADGANLSQGQRQLLSIASAAVADAPVMILDEATSSIDTRTEQLVQKGTNELMKGRTVFFIAHRLSTVQNSDVIMVLENGEIIERGNHKELINKKGKYYQLYTGAYELE